MKKIVVIGAQGQLGQYLLQSLKAYDVVAVSRSQLDLTKIDDIQPFLFNIRADLIINASAYTAVDNAEIEVNTAQLINCDVPEVLAKYAATQGIPFIHYSTDYVFSGDAKEPYKEENITDPQGQYGLTKLAGEEAILATNAKAYIFRTAWVYSNKGSNFYKTMLRLSASRSELKVVNDQTGCPTYAASIAQATAKIVQKIVGGKTFPKGIYHMTCLGETNWAEFARKIFVLNDKQMEVHGIPSSEYPTPAKRPNYSVLDNQKLQHTFGVKLPYWNEALIECTQETAEASAKMDSEA